MILMNNLIKEIASISSLYAFNSELIEIMQNKPSDQFQSNWETSRVMEITSRYSFYFDNLKFYSVLYSFNGRTFNTWFNQNYHIEPALSQPWYPDVLSSNGRMVWVSTYRDEESLGKDLLVFTAARVMKGVYSDQPIGVVFLNIHEEVLYRTYEHAIQPGSRTYIIDRSGNLVSHSNRGQSGTRLESFSQLSSLFDRFAPGSETVLIDGRLYMRSYYPIPEVNWMIVEEVPLASLLSSMNNFMIIMLWVGGLSLTVALLISYLIARSISIPVRQLRLAMRQVEQGDLEIETSVVRKDEIGELSRGFNRMIKRLRELLEQQRNREERKRQAEIEFLQAQIKPHFLYNSLNSIRIMISFGNNEDAETMLTTLSRLLRKTFETKEELIPLSVELDYLKDYLELQTFRYPGRFLVEWDIQNGVEAIPIPRLLLQPLVENAIFHGIEPMKERGWIRIRAAASDPLHLEISVEDNGVGISAHRMNTIWEARGEMSDHVGLTNIRERVALFFGSQSEKYPDLEVVLLTSHAEFEYAKQALKWGAVDYLLKAEITEKELMDTLERSMAAVRKARQAKETGKPDDEELQFKYGSIIGNAVQYMKQHYASPLSLSEVAEHAHVNANYLSQLFKEKTGTNFNDYLTAIRVEKSKHYLLHTDMRAYEVADKVGYPSFSYFSKVFKKIVGISPNEFRYEAEQPENKERNSE